MTDVHFHGYKTDSHGSELTRDSMMLCDYLKTRPAQGRSWRNVDDAVNWVRAEMSPLIARRITPDPDVSVDESLADKIQYVGSELSQRQDVVWSEWLRGGRYVQVSVICCPNRWGDNPCPTGN